MEHDKLHEECGLIGIWTDQHHAIGEKLYDGLISLQHRGQESAGIAVNQYGQIVQYKNVGLVNEVFDEDRINSLAGSLGVGHVRYSTTGRPDRRNAQPLVTTFKGGQMALAHNGNLVNAKQLRDELIDDGYTFETALDTEVITRLIAKLYQGDMAETIQQVCSVVQGAYALVLMVGEVLYGIRDPYGLRPLVLGKTPEGEWVLASETATLDLLGADLIRDLAKGEIVEIKQGEMRSWMFDDTKPQAFCSFEFVYFARPDSIVEGKTVLSVRKQLGAILASYDDDTYDLVAPVPDSGIAAAIGYSHAAKIPYTTVLMKNKYIGRTFLNPTQEQRDRALRLKLNVQREEVFGKRIVLVDDSIVRGTTMKKLIHQLKTAGAKEVHVRISSPPVIHACHFGIDTPTNKSLIGAQMTHAEICRHIGADSLKFLEIRDMLRATGMEKALCKACFDGKYPMAVPKTADKFVFEKEI